MKGPASGWLIVPGCVGERVFPVFWRDDLGPDSGVLSEQVEQVGSIDELDELDGLVLGEVEACLAVAGGRDKDAFARAFVLQGAEEVADG